MFINMDFLISKVRDNIQKIYSYLNDTGVYVDIGCEFPGSTPSVSLDQIQNSKCTLLFEPRSQHCTVNRSFYSNFKNVSIDECFITPGNINEKIYKPLKDKDLLEKIFLIDVDIDGYDFYVAKSLIDHGLKPLILSLEINEKVPPPIKFSVLYSDKYKGSDKHFYGASLSKMEELTTMGYDMIQLFFNSLILIRRDSNPFYTDKDKYKIFKPRTAAELYETQYLGVNLHKLVDYNQNVLHWQNNNIDNIIEHINEHFLPHKGEYEIYR